ncbi:Type II secretory pathway, component ExeA (predicted ATPase) [Aliiroseovarius sediminilitoris]|uniref:Type II secretory pathway, component ExeA (Predicted ATPase) n=1 Tax=Aliiroseovarius sediminilitoris TaxID=1173584 RepID=A0A1I0R9Q7_9RHOB|nr:AAA family ATPase [Aliiroseovarius sediminilitoris]SEW37520.1 Type II secretory pathway, component ExeA (predicted ATPase) [Aliiroseovarius sediminilitoris]
MNSNELYTGHFGLTERPFTLVPDPSFLFWSKQHKRAYAVLEFGILSRAPITLITGEIGSGKTTLVQKLLSQMDDSVRVGLLSNVQGDRGELLQWVMNALSIPFEPSESYVTLFQRFQESIVSEYAEGRRVVLIIDEAQNLSSEGLEEMRMLTNINANKDELIQLILVGQPELKDIVLSPGMRQLAQRVAASFHLEGMDETTVRAYIKHRLKVAGGTGSEITPLACAEVFKATKGIPRLVNQLCELSLLYAWSSSSKRVSVKAVRNVLEDGVFFASNLADDNESLPKDVDTDEDTSKPLFLRAARRVDIPKKKTG